jgi:hypothetical protein
MIEIRTKSGVALDLAPDAEFEIEMSNPLLEGDGIPVAFSTSISFPPTNTNRTTFGYFPAMMLPPTILRVGAYIFCSGVQLLSGTLVYDSVDEAGNLLYTFTEREIDDSLCVKLYKLNLPKSKRAGESGGWTADELAARVRAGSEAGVGAPLLFDPDGAVTKFHNLPDHDTDTRFTPCVSIQRMLSAISAFKLNTNAAIYSLDKIYVLGLHKEFSGNIKGYGDFLSIANSLPDVTLMDVLKEVCKMLCATIYKDGDGYALVNFSLVGYSVTLDWDAKVCDTFSLSVEPAQGYKFGWPKEESDNEGIPSSEVTTVNTLKGVLDARQYGQYVPVYHSGTLTAVQGTFDTFSVPSDYINFGSHEYAQVCEILNVYDEPVDTEINGTAVDNQMSADLIRNVPCYYNLEEWDEDDSYPQGGTWISVTDVYRMAGLVTFPADGDERDSKIIFGLFENNQLVGKGYKMSDAGADQAVTSGYNLAAYSLQERHQKYQTWLAKNRQVISIDLDLSLQDIANFRFWHAVRVRSRQFIVKRLTFRLSARRDRILSSAELVEM